jgi:hypothetical protein
MMGCEPGSCRRILDEARIHKYTHTNHKLRALNIKYYNFGLCFDTIEFCSRKITRRCGSDTLDDTRETPCPKMPPSEVVNTYGVSQYMVQPSSLDFSLVIVLGITRRKRRTTYTQLDQ